jgi:hypothetical protein
MSTTILLSPLNSIFMFDNKYTNPLKLVENFLKIVSDFANYEQTLESVFDYLTNVDMKEYLTKRIQLIPFVLKDFLGICLENNIKLKLDVKKQSEQKIINFITELLGIKHFFSTTDECINIIISENVNDLINFSENTFTIFNFLIFDSNDEYLNMQKTNIELLRKIKPNLIIESLRQSNLFIKFVDSKLKINKKYDAIKSEFFDNQLKVVYIFDVKSSSKSYRKRELATSSENILYTPFINKFYGLDDDFILYKDHKVLLQRCPYFYEKDPSCCLKLQEIIEKRGMLCIHKFDVLDKCSDRFMMYTFLKKFLDENKNEIKIKLSEPYTLYFEITEEGFDHVYNQIKQKLKENSEFINYPFILKTNSCSVHEMELILNEEGLVNFLKCEKNLKNIYKNKKYICQQYLPHGGLMFKNYYINNSSLTVTRPSLPDLEGKTLEMDHFKQGCFKFKNEFLYQKQDPTFWDYLEKTSTSMQVDLSKIDLKELDNVSKLFAEKTNITLFGLDYLYDINKDEYYLIEINYFPSYRELGWKMIKQFEEHIIDLYNKK